MTQNLIAAEQENDPQAQICVESPVTGALKPVVNSFERERASQHFSEHPHPATVAAIEFQDAWLLNDSHSSVNWPGHGNLVVNTPGGLQKKYDNLRRFAKGHFPSRGDTLDVLNQTIDEYGLGGYANPFGFWKAFMRDMMDAAKKADEAKCVPFETGSRNNCHEWKPSEGSHNHEKKQAKEWLTQKYSEISTAKTPAAQKWKNVLASDNPLDQLIVEAYNRVLADKDVMEEIAGSEREVASLVPIVREIRLLSACSQAQAYRMLEKFRKRWADGRQKSLSRTQYFREKGPPSVAMPIGGESDEIEHRFRGHVDQDRSEAMLAFVILEKGESCGSPQYVVSHQVVHI